MSMYRCDVCGCYLDPGEGRICDECQDEIRRKKAAAKRVEPMIGEGQGGQYEMRGVRNECTLRAYGAV